MCTDTHIYIFKIIYTYTNMQKAGISYALFIEISKGLRWQRVQLCFLLHVVLCRFYL